MKRKYNFHRLPIGRDVMKRMLGASRILANIAQIKGFTTRRELADFFGVGPSAVTDWVNRKGDRIPEKRLSEACRLHGLRWQWIAYGETPPYEEVMVDRTSGIELTPREMELIARVKASPQFRGAVDRLLGLGDAEIRLISQVAHSMSGGKSQETDTAGAPYRKWISRYPLTNPG